MVNGVGKHLFLASFIKGSHHSSGSYATNRSGTLQKKALKTYNLQIFSLFKKNPCPYYFAEGYHKFNTCSYRLAISMYEIHTIHLIS